MSDNDSFMRFMAAWALVHETADEGWKAAVERGREQRPGGMDAGPEAFVDGLSALISQEKERLKRQLADGGVGTEQSEGADALIASIDELRFEVAEMRGRLESLQASLDSLIRRDGTPEA